MFKQFLFFASSEALRAELEEINGKIGAVLSVLEQHLKQGSDDHRSARLNWGLLERLLERRYALCERLEIPVPLLRQR
ncbi:MAG TPA: hypothetical protein VHC68_00255 [Candidatus Paceibacterota bacterium]|nr:hypothetical protein [Candidatus Paceibacterota bacterium]